MKTSTPRDLRIVTGERHVDCSTVIIGNSLNSSSIRSHIRPTGKGESVFAVFVWMRASIGDTEGVITSKCSPIPMIYAGLYVDNL